MTQVRTKIEPIKILSKILSKPDLDPAGINRLNFEFNLIQVNYNKKYRLVELKYDLVELK